MAASGQKKSGGAGKGSPFGVADGLAMQRSKKKKQHHRSHRSGGRKPDHRRKHRNPDHPHRPEEKRHFVERVRTHKTEAPLSRWLLFAFRLRLASREPLRNLLLPLASLRRHIRRAERLKSSFNNQPQPVRIFLGVDYKLHVPALVHDAHNRQQNYCYFLK